MLLVVQIRRNPFLLPHPTCLSCQRSSWRIGIRSLKRGNVITGGGRARGNRMVVADAPMLDPPPAIQATSAEFIWRNTQHPSSHNASAPLSNCAAVLGIHCGHAVDLIGAGLIEICTRAYIIISCM